MSSADGFIHPFPVSVTVVDQIQAEQTAAMF